MTLILKRAVFAFFQLLILYKHTGPNNHTCFGGIMELIYRRALRDVSGC